MQYYRGQLGAETASQSHEYFPLNHFAPAIGAAAVFVSAVSTVSALGSLRYEFAIPIPSGDRSAQDILLLSARLLMGISVTITIVVGGFYLFDVHGALRDTVGPWAWTLPDALLLAGSINIVESWIVRKKLFKAVAYSDVLQAGTIGGGRVILGWSLGRSMWALMWLLAQYSSSLSLRLIFICQNGELKLPIRQSPYSRSVCVSTMLFRA